VELSSNCFLVLWLLLLIFFYIFSVFQQEMKIALSIKVGVKNFLNKFCIHGTRYSITFEEKWKGVCCIMWITYRGYFYITTSTTCLTTSKKCNWLLYFFPLFCVSSLLAALLLGLFFFLQHWKALCISLPAIFAFEKYLKLLHWMCVVSVYVLIYLYGIVRMKNTL